MKSKLLALCAAGALVMTVAPAALAGHLNNPGGSTNATLTVTSGTTIYAPASINLGSGFPGETTSGTATVEWLSNEGASKNIAVQASTLTCGACTGTYKTIDNEDLGFAVGTGGTETSRFGGTPLNVHTLAADDAEYDAAGDTPSSQAFKVWVHIPSVDAGAYVGTLTFSVQ
jgi:hypothetical protein